MPRRKFIPARIVETERAAVVWRVVDGAPIGSRALFHAVEDESGGGDIELLEDPRTGVVVTCDDSQNIPLARRSL